MGKCLNECYCDLSFNMSVFVKMDGGRFEYRALHKFHFSNLFFLTTWNNILDRRLKNIFILNPPEYYFSNSFLSNAKIMFQLNARCKDRLISTEGLFSNCHYLSTLTKGDFALIKEAITNNISGMIQFNESHLKARRSRRAKEMLLSDRTIYCDFPTVVHIFDSRECETQKLRYSSQWMLFILTFTPLGSSFVERKHILCYYSYCIIFLDNFFIEK